MTKRRRRSAGTTRRTTTTRRRRAHSSAAHTATHHRRRARRNPPAMLRGVVPFVTGAALGAVTATGGKIVARKVRGLLKQAPTSVFGMGAEALVGLVGGLMLSRVSPQLGRDFAIGGLQAPLETSVQRMSIPHVSDALADDGYLLGDGTGLYPDALAGYVSGGTPQPGALGDERDGLGNDSGLRFVAA
jgi:hypothetical protein